jgi:hypothetical protein
VLKQVDTERTNLKKNSSIFVFFIKKSRRKILPVLTEEINLTVDSPVFFTVRRSLVNYGMNGRVACKKPLLRKVNIQKCWNLQKNTSIGRQSNGNFYWWNKSRDFRDTQAESLFDEHQVNVNIMNVSSQLSNLGTLDGDVACNGLERQRLDNKKWAAYITQDSWLLSRVWR